MQSTMPPFSSAEVRRTSVLGPTAPTRVDSRELLRGAREIVIRHGDQEYRLRHTQNDKLILTK